MTNRGSLNGSSFIHLLVKERIAGVIKVQLCIAFGVGTNLRSHQSTFVLYLVYVTFLFFFNLISTCQLQYFLHSEQGLTTEGPKDAIHILTYFDLTLLEDVALRLSGSEQIRMKLPCAEKCVYLRVWLSV